MWCVADAAWLWAARGLAVMAVRARLLGLLVWGPIGCYGAGRASLPLLVAVQQLQECGLGSLWRAYRWLRGALWSCDWHAGVHRLWCERGAAAAERGCYAACGLLGHRSRLRYDTRVCLRAAGRFWVLAGRASRAGVVRAARSFLARRATGPGRITAGRMPFEILIHTFFGGCTIHHLL